MLSGGIDLLDAEDPGLGQSFWKLKAIIKQAQNFAQIWSNARKVHGQRKNKVSQRDLGKSRRR